MTYGIPYSFVPGTKAKADEVNANFIDVIERIEATNSNVSNNYEDVITRIDDTNTQLNNKTYGSWVNSYTTIAGDQEVPTTNNIAYNLSNYLPNDGNKYEVIVVASYRTTAQSGKVINVDLRSDIITSNVCVGRVRTYTNNSAYGSGCAIMPIGTGRKLYMAANTSNNAGGNFSLLLVAYKKIV